MKKKKSARSAAQPSRPGKSPWHLTILDPADVAGSYAAVMQMIAEAKDGRPANVPKHADKQKLKPSAKR